MGKLNDPQNMSWKTFGFPDVGFLPAWKPAEGLSKALAERTLPFAAKWDFEAVAENAILPMLASPGSGHVWCRMFDSRLKTTAERYLNHTKPDWSDLSDWSDVMWTWEELLLAAADDDEDAVIDSAKGDLSPEWNLEWILQRMAAVNLLRYAPVPYRYDTLSGSTHNGIPSSPSESIAAAVAGVQPGIGSGLPSSYVNNIYGPDHGWREGSYCCNVTLTTRIYALLPEGMEADSNVYLLMQVAGADGTDESFSGSGVDIGFNFFPADADGVFAEFDPSGVGAEMEVPTKDHETYGGWKATKCSAYADYGKLFKFK